MIVLEANELLKIYQLGEHQVVALGGVNFNVRKGEFVAIMGPSGSGKSTLLHLLGGLDDPSQGSIRLAGKVLSGLNDQEATLVRRHNIGFVFQFFNLVPTLNAEENILLPIIIDGKDPRKFSDRLEKLLQLVGLSDRRGHRPDQLSGGEQQRVAIARALISQPAIILADEPTGNLDSKTGRVIMQLLRKSCDEFNQAIVVVSHDPRAAAYADRVIFLKDGKIEQEVVFETQSSAAVRLRTIMEVMEQMESQE